jgi:hypothetical protein
VNGRGLCGAFYDQAVRPLLGDIPHSAGLVGAGSEVLGYDDETSTDHSFGPRVFVFVEADAAGIERDVDQQLLDEFNGWATRFGPVYRRLTVDTAANWTSGYLGFDATQTPTFADWVATPTQLLGTIVNGAIFHDGLGVLGPMQERLRWYPDDVWRYVLAAQWRRVAQEEHFVGRTAATGDHLGSRLLVGRIARDLIRMAFLLEREYAPYVKWTGHAFRRLPIAATLGPALDRAVAAATYADREHALADAYEIAMRATNELGLAEPCDPTVRPFFERGYLVTFGDRIADALRAAITDDDVRSLPPHLGAVDQYVDSTDVLSHPDLLRRVTRADRA